MTGRHPYDDALLDDATEAHTGRDEDVDDGARAASLPGLWPGDPGTLRAPSRRALVQLLRGPYLSAARHPALWSALLTDEATLRSRLADLFLDLVVDTDQEVAFVRNVDHDDVDTPRVVRSAPLTFMDTALLLHLRQRLLGASGGERVIVGQEEVVDHLMVYRGADDTDQHGFTKRITASWEKVKKYGLLAATSTEGRYEVSPVLRLIFGPDQIAAVRAQYATLAAQAGAPAPGVGGMASAAGAPSGTSAEDRVEELVLDLEEHP